jgi:hypothetical protein
MKAAVASDGSSDGRGGVSRAATEGGIVKVCDLVPGPVTPLAEIAVDELTPERFWAEHVCTHRPLVIRGGARHWPAVERWSGVDYLRSKVLRQRAVLAESFNALPFDAFRHTLPDTTVRDALDLMAAAPPTKTYSIASFGVPRP